MPSPERQRAAGETCPRTRVKHTKLLIPALSEASRWEEEHREGRRTLGRGHARTRHSSRRPADGTGTGPRRCQWTHPRSGSRVSGGTAPTGAQGGRRARACSGAPRGRVAVRLAGDVCFRAGRFVAAPLVRQHLRPSWPRVTFGSFSKCFRLFRHYSLSRWSAIHAL